MPNDASGPGNHPASLPKRVEERFASYVSDPSQEVGGVLDLSGCGLWAGSISALLGRLEALEGLQTLDLDWNQLGAEGMKALAGSAVLEGLKTLHLGWNQIGAEGMKALAGSAALEGLKALDLVGNKLGAEGMKALAGSAVLEGLKALDLGWNRIGDEGMKALAGSAALEGLKALDLVGNKLGAEGMKALAGSAALEGLQTLDLGCNEIGDEGMKALAVSAVLEGLQTLNLYGNGIGDEGMKALAVSAALEGLQTLYLGENLLKDAFALIQMLERFDRQLEINLSGNPLKTPEGTPLELSGLSVAPQPVLSVIKILREALSLDAGELNEVRVNLVGVAKNGKSQLARALVGNLGPGQTIPIQQRTEGMDIWEMDGLDVSGVGEVKVRFFDGAGDADQYLLHRVFWQLQRNALLLVIDPCKEWGWMDAQGNHGNRGAHLIRMMVAGFGRLLLQTRNPDAKLPPTLVVRTKKDLSDQWCDQTPSASEIVQQYGQQDESEAGRKLKMLAVAEEINPVTHEGLEEVREALARTIALVPGVKTQIAGDFFEVREALQERFFEDPHRDRESFRSISMNEYGSLCESVGVSDADEQAFYLRTLCALGDVIHLEDEPRLSQHVINTRWARKALYWFVTDRKVVGQKGLVSETDLAGLDEVVPELLLELAIARQVVFEAYREGEVVYGEKQQEPAWVIPDALPSRQKGHVWAQLQQPEVVLKPKDGFLPESVFLTFVGEHYKQLDPQTGVFRDEVLLDSPDGARVLIRPDYTSDDPSIDMWADPNASPIEAEAALRFCAHALLRKGVFDEVWEINPRDAAYATTEFTQERDSGAGLATPSSKEQSGGEARRVGLSKPGWGMMSCVIGAVFAGLFWHYVPGFPAKVPTVVLIGFLTALFMWSFNPKYWARRLAATSLSMIPAGALFPHVAIKFDFGSTGGGRYESAEAPAVYYIVLGVVFVASLAFEGFRMWLERHNS